MKKIVHSFPFSIGLAVIITQEMTKSLHVGFFFPIKSRLESITENHSPRG